ncbi:DNA polymerase/3'-5' exonuclease PolX [candidate division WWE3 bacterium]|uniref:DNA polymerase/3'-5' exonuclease PolX n=1 Tax=candidate division WWE3 bacterium TaxID=2053526 RepID=A0A7X9DJZ0_UNCKA|nr:DNA polymerase/3'-5' exonuclease PolX [candidate division WWE3 bacterium]
MNNRISNSEVVAILKEVLAAMEIKGADRFRIRAYQNAVAIIDGLTTSIQDIWEEGRLDDVPGIGSALASHLNDLFTKGLVSEFESVKKGLPDGMFALLGLRGVGAKKAFKLAATFDLKDRSTALEELKKHAQAGHIKTIEGFGEKSEADILDSIQQSKTSKNDKQRMLLVKAEQIIGRVIEYMKTCPGVEKVDALGSIRRRNPTVGDLDMVVSTTDSAAAIEYFINYPESHDVVAKGDKKAVILLTGDIQVDLRVSSPEAYGSMLQYNTGSKQHNVLLRTYALEKGMSLSEYGIKRDGELRKYKTEENFYRAVGLPYIPPELRQGTDEIDLARKDQLPNLITLTDIKGDLQSHTIFSDGANTLEEMVEKAINLRYEYYGVTDHGPSVINRGYKEVERMLLAQREKIDKINASQNKIKVLYGMEVNILADATLGLPDDLLKILDYALGSIHTAFTQDKATITKRVVKAIENPYISFIGHPTGRLINEREACDIDWKIVFDALLANDKTIEINAQPDRLDLTEDLVRVAVKKGIKLIVNTDAHSTDQLDLMKYGIDTARRGFCEKRNVINTNSYKDFVTLLRP